MTRSPIELSWTAKNWFCGRKRLNGTRVPLLNGKSHHLFPLFLPLLALLSFPASCSTRITCIICITWITCITYIVCIIRITCIACITCITCIVCITYVTCITCITCIFSPQSEWSEQGASYLKAACNWLLLCYRGQTHRVANLGASWQHFSLVTGWCECECCFRGVWCECYCLV